MGGKAFSTGPNAVRTPRMVPEVYVFALNRTTNALEKLFPNVKSPIEGPEKASFGDIDVMVSLEGAAFTKEELDDPQKEAVWAAVKEELGAYRVIHDKNAYGSQTFAVSRPGDIDADVWERQVKLMQEEETKAEFENNLVESMDWFFIQVDVQLTDTTEELEWRAL